jgi:hypothetical protein
VASIGVIVRAFLGSFDRYNVKLRAGVAEGYVQNLRRLIAWARGLHTQREGAQRRTVDEAAVDALPGSVLSAELVEAFEFAYVSSAGTSPMARAAALRGAHAVVRNAKALFGRRALRCYAKLVLPDVSSFMAAQLNRADAAPLRDLEDATVQAMARAALGLRESDRELYVVHLCCRHLGMRPVELAAARVGWFAPRAVPARVVLPSGEVRAVVADVAIVKTHDFDPKGTEGAVSISADVWAELLPFLQGRPAGEYLLEPGTVKRETLRLVYERHADFVRPWLGEFAKKGYELRRWGATKVATLHESEEKAERFLRHAKRTTAGRHYITRDAVIVPITLGDCGI